MRGITDRVKREADDYHDETAEKKLHKIRPFKRRTRTGCWTCRRRRIKCDEGHPTCKNCTKSRRECEGYGQRVVFKDTRNTCPHDPNEAVQNVFDTLSPDGSCGTLTSAGQSPTDSSRSHLSPRNLEECISRPLPAPLPKFPTNPGAQSFYQESVFDQQLIHQPHSPTPALYHQDLARMDTHQFHGQNASALLSTSTGEFSWPYMPSTFMPSFSAPLPNINMDMLYSLIPQLVPHDVGYLPQHGYYSLQSPPSFAKNPEPHDIDIASASAAFELPMSEGYL